MQLSETADFTSMVLDETGLTEPAMTPAVPLQYGASYYWRVRGVNQGGMGLWSETWGFIVAQGTGTETASDLPDRVALHAAYPNPVEGRLTLPFDLPQASHVRMEIYDSLGRLRATPLDNPVAAGRHRESIDLSGFTAGLYLVRFEAGSFHTARSIVVMP
jgi:hypothetical protein